MPLQQLAAAPPGPQLHRNAQSASDTLESKNNCNPVFFIPLFSSNRCCASHILLQTMLLAPRSISDPILYSTSFVHNQHVHLTNTHSTACAGRSLTTKLTLCNVWVLDHDGTCTHPHCARNRQLFKDSKPTDQKILHVPHEGYQLYASRIMLAHACDAANASISDSCCFTLCCCCLGGYQPATIASRSNVDYYNTIEGVPRTATKFFSGFPICRHVL